MAGPIPAFTSHAAIFQLGDLHLERVSESVTPPKNGGLPGLNRVNGCLMGISRCLMLINDGLNYLCFLMI